MKIVKKSSELARSSELAPSELAQHPCILSILNSKIKHANLYYFALIDYPSLQPSWLAFPAPYSLLVVSVAVPLAFPDADLLFSISLSARQRNQLKPFSNFAVSPLYSTWAFLRRAFSMGQFGPWILMSSGLLEYPD